MQILYLHCRIITDLHYYLVTIVLGRTVKTIVLRSVLSLASVANWIHASMHCQPGKVSHTLMPIFFLTSKFHPYWSCTRLLQLPESLHCLGPVYIPKALDHSKWVAFSSCTRNAYSPSGQSCPLSRCPWHFSSHLQDVPLLRFSALVSEPKYMCTYHPIRVDPSLQIMTVLGSFLKEYVLFQGPIHY